MSAVSLRRLSFLDRYLTLWIFLAMAAGILLGHLAPAVGTTFEGWRVGQTSIPIAIGLIAITTDPLLACTH